jgi:hypothetical protein
MPAHIRQDVAEALASGALAMAAKFARSRDIGGYLACMMEAERLCLEAGLPSPLRLED